MSASTRSSHPLHMRTSQTRRTSSKAGTTSFSLMDNSIGVLEDFLVSAPDLFMPGHGLPADQNEAARNIEYLSAATEAVGSGLTSEAFRAFMLKRDPERRCLGIFDIYLPRLFGSA